MPSVLKILGQSNPSPNTATTLYTVPASNNTVVSTITVSNLVNTPAAFRIACRPAGAVLSNSHYISYDTVLSGSDTIGLTMGITLAATDVLTVYANTASVNFTAFGSENY